MVWRRKGKTPQTSAWEKRLNCKLDRIRILKQSTHSAFITSFAYLPIYFHSFCGGKIASDQLELEDALSIGMHVRLCLYFLVPTIQ